MNGKERWPRRALVFGATGGIGAALCRMLADGGAEVHAGSRNGEAPKHHAIHPFRFDLEDEQSIASVASRMGDMPPDLVVVATGVLTLPDGSGPERSCRAIDPAAMTEVLRVNAIGPALIAKYFLPLFPREGRSVFAALSARVGSISDNGIGGWHSYRASKAALNMLLANFAIEMRRTHPDLIVAGIHPGTVDTKLSAPFQANLPEGQLVTRHEAARNLVDVLCGLLPEDSGGVFAWDGERIPA